VQPTYRIIQTLKKEVIAEKDAPITASDQKLMLPPKPQLVDKKLPYQTLPVTEPELIRGVAIDFDSTEIAVTLIPTLTEPTLVLNPTYKVMQKHPSKHKSSGVEGSIKLNYQITRDGSVSNIKVVKSTLNILFEKSAKKALSQWKFKTAKNT
jgi:TonB family protein